MSITLKNNIAVITANLGKIDRIDPHVPQSMPYDYYLFDDGNFPPRFCSITPRLQAKIPKCFGWQMVSGYKYYFWIDGNLTMIDKNSLKYFFDNLKGYDIVVLKHPRRNTIKWEGRYLERGLKQGSRYLYLRYENELLKEQMAEISADKDFTDNTLVNGGVFMYKNTPEVQNMLKEWWYHISRYLIMDQCSFAYVLKKSGLKINVRPDNLYYDCKYLKHHGHTRHGE